jgi:hypothetical protein
MSIAGQIPADREPMDVVKKPAGMIAREAVGSENQP